MNFHLSQKQCLTTKRVRFRNNVFRVYFDDNSSLQRNIPAKIDREHQKVKVVPRNGHDRTGFKKPKSARSLYTTIQLSSTLDWNTSSSQRRPLDGSSSGSYGDRAIPVVPPTIIKKMKVEKRASLLRLCRRGLR
jgi:hypothetical protein